VTEKKTTEKEYNWLQNRRYEEEESREPTRLEEDVGDQEAQQTETRHYLDWHPSSCWLRLLLLQH
jgi:hypothetical protein